MRNVNAIEEEQEEQEVGQLAKRRHLLAGFLVRHRKPNQRPLDGLRNRIAADKQRKADRFLRGRPLGADLYYQNC